MSTHRCAALAPEWAGHGLGAGAHHVEQIASGHTLPKGVLLLPVEADGVIIRAAVAREVQVVGAGAGIWRVKARADAKVIEQWVRHVVVRVRGVYSVSCAERLGGKRAKARPVVDVSLSSG